MTDPTRLRFSGQASFALADPVEADSAEVAVLLRYKFVEDGAAGTQCAMEVEAPDGFTEDDGASGRFVGPLTHEAKQFRFITDSYSSDWSGQISVEADLVGEEVAT